MYLCKTQISYISVSAMKVSGRKRVTALSLFSQTVWSITKGSLFIIPELHAKKKIKIIRK
jgi:hypothetical protein